MSAMRAEKRAFPAVQPGTPLWCCGVAVLAVGLTLLLQIALNRLLHKDAPLLAFTLAVLLAARYGGQGAGILATFLSALIGASFLGAQAGALDGVARILLFVFIGVLLSVLMGELHRARARAEESAEAQRRSEERFRLLVAGVRDYAIFLIDPQGCVTTWNEGAERLKGYTAEEILGHPVSRFYPPEDVARGLPQQALAAACAEGRYETEAWRVRKDGSRFLAHVVLTAIHDESGALRGFAKVTRDITEGKREEAEMEAALERERHVSASLQRSLLLAPPEDTFPGIAVATLYEAAWEEASVGGDFFDVFATEGGRIALVVGDLSGKGLAAAVRTAEVKYTLRAYLSEYGDIGQALGSLNKYLCDAPRTGREAVLSFTVLSLAVIDPVSGAAALSVAGAEPPLILRADGRMESMDPKDSGLPLGIEPGEEYLVTALQLARGDTLLMTTDGIIEARHGGNLFGPEGMERVAAQAAARGSLRQVGQSILDAARAFAGGTLQDDVCLLLARLR